jgi:hypothetical protein
MYTNKILENQQLSKIPIRSKWRKKPVGDVFPARKTFRKTIRGSRHFLRKPTLSIANDIDVLERAQSAGAEWCEVEDLETHTTYRAKIDTILERGYRFNRGWGNQVALELGAFIQQAKPVQLSLLDGVEV